MFCKSKSIPSVSVLLVLLLFIGSIGIPDIICAKSPVETISELSISELNKNDTANLLNIAENGEPRAQFLLGTGIDLVTVYHRTSMKP